MKVDGQLLAIRGERTPRRAEGVNWITRERWTGTVERRFSLGRRVDATLGRRVDTTAISASYDHGVLSVVIPVAETATPRTVEVTTGSGDDGTPAEDLAA